MTRKAIAVIATAAIASLGLGHQGVQADPRVATNGTQASGMDDDRIASNGTERTGVDDDRIAMNGTQLTGLAIPSGR